MGTPSTVGKLSTEQFSAPQTTPSMCVKSCSLLREWRVSSAIKVTINDNKGDLTNGGVSQYSASSLPGSLEDWDIAVQKTETRLNRINEQRAKVKVHDRTALCSSITQLLLSNVTMSGHLLGSRERSQPGSARGGES